MRESDGAYRTLDSRALHEHRGAAAAIATVVMESALSREFGTGWVARADGHGREVRGVSAALMAEFSSRRQSISALTARLAAEFAGPARVRAGRPGAREPAPVGQPREPARQAR